MWELLAVKQRLCSNILPLNPRLGKLVSPGLLHGEELLLWIELARIQMMSSSGPLSPSSFYEPLCEMTWRITGHLLHAVLVLDSTAANSLPEPLGQVKMLVQTNMELSKKLNMMRRDYLRELTSHRDKQRTISDEANGVLEDLQENPVMFFEPLKFVLDDVTKEFIKLVVEERVTELAGPWDFAYLGDVSLAHAAQIREEDWSRGRRWVPDAFNAREWLCAESCPDGSTQPCYRCCVDGCPGHRECCDPVALGRRGVAAYRTFLEPQVSLLYFRGCGLHCVILLDRVKVVEHEGSYSPFWVDLSVFPKRSGELLVLADSRFGTLQRLYFDWFQPGGLLRPVEAHILLEPTCYLHSVAVTPLGGAEIMVALKVAEGCPSKSLELQLSFDGAPPSPRSLRGTAASAWRATVPGARPWSPARPALHLLTLSLLMDGRQVDSMTVRFGLRSIEARQGQLLLNGEPLMLLGLNRHESHPKGGVYLPMEQLHEDIQLLKQLGANFVRGAHYSQDQRFLDLCDEHGLLVWEETVAWQPSLEDLMDETFMALQAQALEETIDASINHPSVIIWGFLNEGASNEIASRQAYGKLASLARSKDASRLVTWASRHKTRDVTLDLADVIAFNDYPGWYDASVMEIPETWENYADWARQNHPGKALLLAEAGAGGLAGWRSRPGEEDMWSEERQASIIGATISAALASGFSAVALWQFADCRVDAALFEGSEATLEELPEPLLNVSESAEWMERVAVGYQITNSPFGFHQALRPRNLNNKGLVSISRQHKKLSFYTAQAGFQLCAPSMPGVPLAPAEEELVEVKALEETPGCPGCHLAVHTWNVADRPPGDPGVRVHGHRLAQRRSRWGLRRGFLRLAGHADGRSSALGGFLTVSGRLDSGSSYVSVREVWMDFTSR
eukprot:s556_g3.t1